jgi:nitrogen fixation NifU-like protein
MAYGEKVLDHYENPRNVGQLDDRKRNVGTGMVGAPACGDVMRLQIEVNDDVITDASIKNMEIAQHLALPPVKIHCSVLAEDAIKTAIRNYKEKQSA